MLTPATSAKAIKLATSLIDECALLGWHTALTEVNLSPKPDPVDRINYGMYRNVAPEDLHRSALVIQGWPPRFIEFGACSAEIVPEAVFRGLRPTDVACESGMFRATAGVNTYKGSTSSLGLLCAAIGRSFQFNQPITLATVCSITASFCRGLTDRELRTNNSQLTTGQWLHQQPGLTGVHGEIEAGYPLATNYALPHYLTLLDQGLDPESTLLDILLLLMAINGDTNVVSRGGKGNLRWL